MGAESESLNQGLEMIQQPQGLVNYCFPTFHRWSVWTVKHEHQRNWSLEEAAELEEEDAQFRVFPFLCMKTLAADGRCAIVQPDAGIMIGRRSDLTSLARGSPHVDTNDKAVPATVVA
jgi:hypothetical protein